MSWRDFLTYFRYFLAAVRQQCKYYRIYEVARDGTVRRLEDSELVWGWERNNPDVETQLVFKQLIGLLNFAISYPETAVVVGLPVDVRVKVRDPDNGNVLVNDHRGELALFVCAATESDSDGTEVDIGANDSQVERILAQRTDQDGVFSMPYTPPTVGGFHMMMRFNGFPLQDRVYKLHVVKKKKLIHRARGFSSSVSLLKRGDSKSGGDMSKDKGKNLDDKNSMRGDKAGNKRQSWYLKR